MGLGGIPLRCFFDKATTNYVLIMQQSVETMKALLAVTTICDDGIFNCQADLYASFKAN